MAVGMLPLVCERRGIINKSQADAERIRVSLEDIACAGKRGVL
jgi:hypothetical protein